MKIYSSFMAENGVISTPFFLSDNELFWTIIFGGTIMIIINSFTLI